MSQQKKVRVIITGGGTGGHTTPAVAVIQALKQIAESEDIGIHLLYIGSKEGVEAASAADLGVTFVGIETGKLRRSKNIFRMVNRQNFADLMRVPTGFFQAMRCVARFRPDVVFSTGGYVSVPAVVAAGLSGVPVVAHEQTVQIGLANKINFRFAKKIALSVDDSLSMLTEKQIGCAVVTGNPIRNIVFGGIASRAIERFGFAQNDNALPTVYVTGGAQGSHLINRAVSDCLPELLTKARVIHQCGVQKGQEPQDIDLLSGVVGKLAQQLKQRYAVVEHVGNEIGDVYALADIVVGRSGAGTVSEICALGKPAVFVPLVPTGGDEQTKNAQRLVDVGAAKIVLQDECNGETLTSSLLPLIEDSGLRTDMGKQAKTLAQNGAAETLARIVLSAAGVVPQESALGK